MPKTRLSRYQLLAAEIFGYSYANYLDHLGIGNVRYDELMPQDARKLCTAVAEQWPLARVAEELEVDTDNAATLMESTRQAIEVVEAENPAESFREAVRQVVKRAVTKGFDGEGSVDELVKQICYRASDLAYLLKADRTSLSRYSRHLRKEPDHEYYDGYFDEEE
jgi:hypothetical protein